MTNSDKIRAMTDDELAKLLSHCDCEGCPASSKHESPYYCCGFDCDSEYTWIKWLKEEAKE